MRTNLNRIPCFTLMAVLQRFLRGQCSGVIPARATHFCTNTLPHLKRLLKWQASDQVPSGTGRFSITRTPCTPGITPTSRDCAGLRHELVPVYAPKAADQPKPGEPEILYYQDAMNPSHHSDKPGLAPDGMKLVPVYASEAPAAALPPGVWRSVPRASK